jgi:hypothetical protein
MLVPIAKKINEECQNNLLNSHKEMPPSVSLRASFELIKKELLDTLEIIAFIKPNRKEWEAIRKICQEFLEQQSNVLREDFVRTCGHKRLESSEFELLSKEAAAEYNTFIDGQLLNLSKMRRVHFYDIVKKVLAAIIGSIIIYYLNKFFFSCYFIFISSRLIKFAVEAGSKRPFKEYPFSNM